MSNSVLTRRRLLEGTAGLAAIGLAGCTASPGGSGGQGTDDPATGDDHSDGDDHPGHGDESHGHDMVSEPKASREVAINTARSGDSTEYHFAPHVTWVEVGGTVTWRLESGTHTATAYHDGNDQPHLVPEGTTAWDSGTMSEEGATFEHTFETEGVYHYLCTPHEQFGMIATVVVGEPHLDDQPALGSMPADKPEEVHGKLEELNGMVHDMMGDGHHDDGTHTDDGHDDGTHTDDGHDDGTHTEDGHDDGTHTDDGHDDGTHTEDGHDDGTHTEDGHDDGTHTEDGHE
jgi:plastocyanin